MAESATNVKGVVEECLCCALQAMIEDEVHHMDEFVEGRFTQIRKDLQERLAEVSGREKEGAAAWAAAVNALAAHAAEENQQVGCDTKFCVHNNDGL